MQTAGASIKMTPMQEKLASDLGKFGAIEPSIRWLGEVSPQNINYLDLIPSSATRPIDKDDLWPSAVIESSGIASAYVLRADALTQTPLDNSRLNRLRHNLACRGDAEYLVVWKPGELHLYRLDLSKALPEPAEVLQGAEGASSLFQDMANASLDAKFGKQHAAVQQAVHQVLFDVLSQVTLALIQSPALNNNRDDVISLVGRALFTRFLIDRGIINKTTFPEIYNDGHPERCFDTHELAAKTCQWLNAKFNGELLPLTDENYTRYFSLLTSLDASIFHNLSNILHRSPGGQTSFELYWDTVNFAHVPIGLLSQVYEHYAHKLFSDGAEAESIYYTPRFIAEFLAGQALAGVTAVPLDQARILDPAAGAGIFLVICLRKLVAARWEATGERPDKKVIRDILNDQIFGFDINSSALRLSALSLYLTALELDPDPFPPESLKFRALLKHNLLVTRGKGEEYPKSMVLGSLGSGAPEGHLKKYDIILGNPPWTSWEGKGSDKLNEYVSKMARAIAGKRGNSKRLNEISAGYENPDKVTDLPFVWQAMEWAKEGGVIAFVLHARLLFKRSEMGSKARDALFSSLRITGILNGIDLDDPSIWPGIQQPFCLLFAQNLVPSDADVFYMVSPVHDEHLGDAGRFRIDYAGAQPIQLSVLRDNPVLIKTLSIGTSLDADVVRRVRALLPIMAESPGGDMEGEVERPLPRFGPTAIRLGDYWTMERGLHSGQGFRIAKDQKQNDATFLLKMRAAYLSAKNKKVKFCIDADKLPQFKELSRNTLHTPRQPETYLTPLVLISESPGANRDAIRARISLGKTPIAFTQSFFGYSSHKHPDSEGVAKYLFVLANSDLFVYYMLMTSSKFGVERRAIYEEDIADFPIIAYEDIPQPKKIKMHELAHALCISPSENDWAELNKWVYGLYLLDPPDQQVIADTLAIRMPYVPVRRDANRMPSKEQVKRFTSKLEGLLKPFFNEMDGDVKCDRRESDSRSWIFIDVVSNEFKGDTAKYSPTIKFFEKLAKDEGTTRVILELEKGYLCIGLIAQRMFFTESRARLCALEIFRHHDEFISRRVDG